MRALVLLLATVLVLPFAAAESPQHGACDSTGRLVCAGADVGASVQCTASATGFASCAWTAGWLTQGSSPLQLPGHESHVVRIDATVCGPSGCVDLRTDGGSSCSWLPAMSCTDDHAEPPGSATAQLALGQCLTVHVDMVVDIVASASAGSVSVATASYHGTGGGAGAACFDDNGRD